MAKRVFWIVLDSVGCGEAPDAADFGDVGSDTLGSCIRSGLFNAPNLTRLGLFNIEGTSFRDENKVKEISNISEKKTEKQSEEAAGNNSDKYSDEGCCGDGRPVGCYCRMQEQSCGKDTTVGHWEMAGMISGEPLPTYPDGFPQEILDKLSEASGRGILCNKPYSGTEVIKDYGENHMKTGALIVYTSADSVLQIAAHEDVVPIEELYSICRKARKIMHGEHGVGRIIARPFEGEWPFQRTVRRHDFSLQPPRETVLDALKSEGFVVIGVGKIFDIFAGKSVMVSYSNKGNDANMERVLDIADSDFEGLCYVNLVDTDMIYGHRRDVPAYTKAINAFDVQLGLLLEKMRDDDMLVITADHGCDPGFTGTDHTREYVPCLIYGRKLKKDVDLGTRPTFADQAATIADYFGISYRGDGESLLQEISQI